MLLTECTRQLELFEVDRQQVTVAFDGGQVVSDAGLLPVAQLDRELGILAEAARRLPDPRSQLFVTHTAEDLLRQQVFQLLAGYPDGNDGSGTLWSRVARPESPKGVILARKPRPSQSLRDVPPKLYHYGNDAQQLRHDPLFQTIVSVDPRDDDRPLASVSPLNRFQHADTRREADKPLEERDVLPEVQRAQIQRIRGLNEFLIDVFVRTRVQQPTEIILDLDPTVDPAHGQQQLTFWHGHYEQNLYFPLLIFEGTTGCAMRVNTAHSVVTCTTNCTADPCRTSRREIARPARINTVDCASQFKAKLAAPTEAFVSIDCQSDQDMPHSSHREKTSQA